MFCGQKILRTSKVLETKLNHYYCSNNNFCNKLRKIICFVIRIINFIFDLIKTWFRFETSPQIFFSFFSTLTHSLLEILPKNAFWSYSRVVFWSLSCYKELKLTTNPFTGRTLHRLLIQVQNISLRSSGMCRKQNFEIVFGFKSDTAVLTFSFPFLSSPLFSLFLLIFFSLAGHLVVFILVEKVSGKTLMILGLNERKGRWLWDKIFFSNFQLNLPELLW